MLRCTIETIPSVILKKNFVGPVTTQVECSAYAMSGHSAVALFKDISWCYHIDCVMGKDTGFIDE